MSLKNCHNYEDLRRLLRIPIEITIKKPPAFNIHEGMKIPETISGIGKIKESLGNMVDKEIQNMKDGFEKIHETIAKGIVDGIKQTSRGIAETIVLGKSFAETLKQIAQKVMINIIAKQIEYIALLGIQKILGKDLNTQDKQKNDLIHQQNSSLKKQIALQMFLNAIGGGSGGGNPLKMFASGGSVRKGQPTIVGERGAELFVPNSTGQIQQNARGTSSQGATVNFNINTVDARGFDELLTQSRGTITQLINQAVNERGAQSII